MDDSEARNRSQPGQAQGSEGGGEGPRDTVAGIVEDLQGIIRNEVQLAKTELKDDASQAGRAAGMVAGGGALGFVGFIFMMLGLTFLLARKLPMWLSASIVGTALGTVAACLGLTGRDQLQGARLKPEQTIESIREDKEWARREMSSVANRGGSVTE